MSCSLAKLKSYWYAVKRVNTAANKTTFTASNATTNEVTLVRSDERTDL